MDHGFFPLCRYAMTVWYFDAEERAEAKKKFRNLVGMRIYFLPMYSRNTFYYVLMSQN